jgi:hypothetical protein
MKTWLVGSWVAHRILITTVAVIPTVALLYRQIMWLCGIIIVPDDSLYGHGSSKWSGCLS